MILADGGTSNSERQGTALGGLSDTVLGLLHAVVFTAVLYTA